MPRFTKLCTAYIQIICWHQGVAACHRLSSLTAAAGLMIFWPVLYFGIFVYYLTKAYNFVHSAPWDQHRVANLLCRLHVSPFIGPGHGVHMPLVSKHASELPYAASADHSRVAQPFVSATCVAFT